jgi:hypothetical protein
MEGYSRKYKNIQKTAMQRLVTNIRLSEHCPPFGLRSHQQKVRLASCHWAKWGLAAAGKCSSWHAQAVSAISHADDE